VSTQGRFHFVRIDDPGGWVEIDPHPEAPYRDRDPVRFGLLFGEADPRLVQRFFIYHAKNPGLYGLYLKYAREAKDRGRGRFSSWMIGNRVRWYTSVETSGPLYKLTNDYFALYSRLIVFEFPEFDGFFEMRAMKARRVGPRE
jgi:hypothetical protein